MCVCARAHASVYFQTALSAKLVWQTLGSVHPNNIYEIYMRPREPPPTFVKNTYNHNNTPVDDGIPCRTRFFFSFLDLKEQFHKISCEYFDIQRSQNPWPNRTAPTRVYYFILFFFLSIFERLYLHFYRKLCQLCNSIVTLLI